MENEQEAPSWSHTRNHVLCLHGNNNLRIDQRNKFFILMHEEQKESTDPTSRFSSEIVGWCITTSMLSS